MGEIVVDIVCAAEEEHRRIDVLGQVDLFNAGLMYFINLIHCCCSMWIKQLFVRL